MPGSPWKYMVSKSVFFGISGRGSPGTGESLEKWNSLNTPKGDLILYFPSLTKGSGGKGATQLSGPCSTAGAGVGAGTGTGAGAGVRFGARVGVTKTLFVLVPFASTRGLLDCVENFSVGVVGP